MGVVGLIAEELRAGRVGDDGTEEAREWRVGRGMAWERPWAPVGSVVRDV